MPAGFKVEAEDRGPHTDELIHPPVRLSDHQVYGHRKSGETAERLYHLGPEGNGRNKVPVHDIDVEPVGPRSFDLGDLLAQFQEIARKNRRSQKNPAA